MPTKKRTKPGKPTRVKRLKGLINTDPRTATLEEKKELHLRRISTNTAKRKRERSSDNAERASEAAKGFIRGQGFKLTLKPKTRKKPAKKRVKRGPKP